MMRKSAGYIAIAVITLLTSCHKDLCHDHTHDSRLEVRFEWSRSTPEGATSMRAYLFPKQGGKPLTADFAGTNGGMMDANYGSYSAIGLSQPDGTTFNKFHVTSLGNGGNYFTDAVVTKGDDGKWVTDHNYYWPDYPLEFYAYAPLELSPSITPDGKTIADFTPRTRWRSSRTY